MVPVTRLRLLTSVCPKVNIGEAARAKAEAEFALHSCWGPRAWRAEAGVIRRIANLCRLARSKLAIDSRFAVSGPIRTDSDRPGSIVRQTGTISQASPFRPNEWLIMRN